MRRRRWMVLIPLSAGVHALGLLTLLWVVARAVDLPPLFVDLSTLNGETAPPRAPAPAERTVRSESTTARASRQGRAGGESRAGNRQRAPVKATPSPEPPRRNDSGGAASPPLAGVARTPPTVPEAPAVTGTTAVREAQAAVTEAPPAIRRDGQEEKQPVPEPARPAAVPSRRSPAAIADADAPGPAPAPKAIAIPSRASSQAPSPLSSPGTAGAGSNGRTPGEPGGGGRGTAPEPSGSGRSAGGSVLASRPPGRGGSGTEYGPYLAQWRRRVLENLRYPPVARRRSLTGTVHLEIVIHPDGAIASVRVAESSTHAVLDEAAVEAVRDLPPLPFPPDLAPRPLRARLPVVFDLR